MHIPLSSWLHTHCQQHSQIPSSPKQQQLTVTTMKLHGYFSLVLLLLVLQVSRAQSAPTLRALQQEDNNNSQCNTLSKAGNFGVLTGSTTLLEFAYEMEYDRFNNRIGDVLDAMETQLVAQLLPTLFGDDCNGKNRNGDFAPFLGVSAKPADQPVPTQTCVAMNDANTCQVVRGRIMLYHKTQPVVTTVHTLEGVLKSAMDEGKLDATVGEGASRVAWVQGNTDTSGFPILPEADATLCHATGTSFGNTASEKGVVIHFGYELEFAAGSTVAVEELLPNVEATLLDRLLPKLFPTKCLDDNDKRRRQLQSTPLQGVASMPTDMVEMSYSCSPRFGAANVCQPIHGQMTIYGGEGGQVLSHIRETLSDAALRKTHSDILDVRYFVLDYQKNGDDNGDDDRDKMEDATDLIPGDLDTDDIDTTYIIVGVAALVAVCLCCCAACFFADRVCRRSAYDHGDGPNPYTQRKKKAAAYDTASSDDDTYYAPSAAAPPASPRRNAKPAVVQQHDEEEGAMVEHENEMPRSPRSPRKPAVGEVSPPSSPKRGYSSPPSSPNRYQSPHRQQQPRSPMKSGSQHQHQPRTPRSVQTQRQAYQSSNVTPSRSVPTQQRPMGAPARLPQAPVLGEDSNHSTTGGRRGSASSATAYASPSRSPRKASSGSHGGAPSHHSRKGSMGSEGGASSHHSRKGSMGSAAPSPHARKGSMGSTSPGSEHSRSPRKASMEHDTMASPSWPRKGSIGGTSSSSPRKGSNHMPSPQRGSAENQSPRKAGSSHQSSSRRGSVGSNATSSSPVKSPRRSSKHRHGKKEKTSSGEAATDALPQVMTNDSSSMSADEPTSPPATTRTPASQGQPLVTLPEAPYLEID